MRPVALQYGEAPYESPMHILLDLEDLTSPQKWSWVDRSDQFSLVNGNPNNSALNK